MSFARTMAGLINTSGDVKASAVGDVGITVYSTLDLLPSTGLTEGDQAYVSSTRRFYISNGSGWYNVALANASPNLTVSNGAVVLATDGVTPTVITLTATDSDNPLAAITYTVESDGSFAGLATLSQDSSVFTITPLSEDSATTTSSTLTFKASDGINFGTDISSFSLTFGPNWSVAPTETIIRNPSPAVGTYFGAYTSASYASDYFATGLWYADDYGTDAGLVHLYYKSNGIWSKQATITSNDIAAGDQFGRPTSLSSDGTYLAVGAAQVNRSPNEGRVYIFTRSGSTWSQQQVLTPPFSGTNMAFGERVTLNSTGDYLFANSLSDTVVNDNKGAVYVFTRSGSTWSQQAKIVAPTQYANAQFGRGNIATNSDGSLVAVVDRYDSTFDTVVQVYSRSGSTWSHQQTVTPTDHQLDDGFGSQVNIAMNSDGTYLLIGSRMEDGGAGDPLYNAGAAYVFTRSGSTWTQQAKLVASDAEANDWFGVTTVLSSDAKYAYVCSSRHPYSGIGAGAVYIFERSGSTWTQIRKLTASDGQNGDGLGLYMALNNNGSTLITGAYTEDGGAGDPYSSSGSIYIYDA